MNAPRETPRARAVPVVLRGRGTDPVTWILPLLLACLVACAAQERPSDAVELDLQEAARCRAAVHALMHACNVGDHPGILARLDQEGARRLRRRMDVEFDGDPEPFLRLLRLARHEGRYRAEYRIEGRQERGECTFRKVVKTGPYTYRDGEGSHPIEEKPVEMWVCFVEEAAEPKIGLAFPLNDLLYLMQ